MASGFHRSGIWLPLLVVVGLAAVVQVHGLRASMAFATAEPYVDDFERDLYGAAAVLDGETPYQQLADIDTRLAGSSEGSYWVGHAPLAVAGALGALWLWGDIEGAASASRAVGVGLTTVAVAGAMSLRRKKVLFAVLAVVGSSSFAAAVRWNQHSLMVAAALLLVLKLEKTEGHRWLGLVLMGVLVALKPWLMPIAFCLPSSTSGWRDVLKVSVVAISATLIAASMLGGIAILRDWLVVALPNNIDAYARVAGNRSVIGALHPTLAAMTFALVTVSLPGIRRYLDRSLWPLLAWTVMMTLSPLVWDVYLIDLSALLLYEIVLRPQHMRVEPLLVVGSTILATFLYFRLALPMVSFVGVVAAQLTASTMIGADIARRHWGTGDRRLLEST